MPTVSSSPPLHRRHLVLRPSPAAIGDYPLGERSNTPASSRRLGFSGSEAESERAAERDRGCCSSSAEHGAFCLRRPRESDRQQADHHNRRLNPAEHFSTSSEEKAQAPRATGGAKSSSLPADRPAGTGRPCASACSFGREGGKLATGTPPVGAGRS